MIQFLKMQVLIPVLIILLACREDDNRIVDSPKEDTFTNPLLTSGADPWVEQKDDWYYFTHTTGRDLRLYRTKKLSELSKAQVKTVWYPPATGMNAKQIWAPEIHYLDGKWYFYYAADDGLNENHRMWVLENSAEDPFAGTWVDKGELALADDKWAIDGTAFEHNGQLYFLWSGWEGDVNVQQDIYITRMVNAWTPEGPRVRLSQPDHDWETKGVKPTINEAPQFLARNGKLFIIYSASGCWTDDYTLGMLSADASSDPMDPASWTKHPEPLLEKNGAAQAYGPGHNCFFTSPDGTEDWIIYHANPEAGQGCGGKRSPRMQPFEWTDDGFPDFGEPVALGAAIPVPSGE